VSEFPLLCINPQCRPEDHGGPRRTERAWFCPACIEKASEKLHAIADAWADLEDVIVSTGGAGSEPVKGTKDVGLVLNEKASTARAKTSADLWAYARMVLEWGDEHGRNMTGPAKSTIPALAQWLADWHLSVLTVHAGRYSAVAFMEDVWSDARAVRAAAYPTGARKVPTGLRCTEHVTGVDGDRLPCPGQMVAWVRPQASTLPDLVCEDDRTHVVDPATWQRVGWKRAHATLDPGAMLRLAERLA